MSLERRPAIRKARTPGRNASLIGATSFFRRRDAGSRVPNSARGSLHPRSAEQDNGNGGTARQSRHENDDADMGRPGRQGRAFQDEMDIDGDDDNELWSHDDQENRPPPQHNRSEANFQEESSEESSEDDHEPHQGFVGDDEDQDEDDEIDLDQQEEHGRDVDSDFVSLASLTVGEENQKDHHGFDVDSESSTTDSSTAGQEDREGHNDQDHQVRQQNRAARAIQARRAKPMGPPDPARQAAALGNPRPKFPLTDRQKLQNQAVFRNTKPHNPGYTNSELKAILKRPRAQDDGPSSSTTRTPKRARFAPTTIGGDGHRSSTLQDAVESPEEVFGRILNVPERLSLVQMNTAFTALQDESLHFARKFFDFELSDKQIAAWPLGMLKYEFFGLKEIAQFLTDGESSTWRELFTAPESRVALIHGIIGEYLKHHVFKATAFSFTGQLREKFEKLDQEYINHDAFVRNKKRAALLTRIIRETNGFWLVHREYMFNASNILAQELLTLFEPLLPPPMFDPLVSSRILLVKPSTFSFTGGKLSPGDERDANFLWDAMIHDLRTLIYKAAALHLSIRLSGQNGTNIRMLHHVDKGSPYHGPETMECINEKECNNKKPWQRRSGDDEMKVRMTCWSHIEAVVPHGIDFEEYQKMEAELQERGGRGSQDTRTFDKLERYFGDRLPQLPPELRERDPEEEDGPREDGTRMDYAFFQAQQHDEDRTKGRKGKERDHSSPEKQQRGSYVTFYRSIVRSHVYCSWGKRGQNRHEAQSLDEAVEEARREAGGFYTLEDTFVKGRDAIMHLADTSVGIASHGLNKGKDAAAWIEDKTGIWKRRGLYFVILGGSVLYALGNEHEVGQAMKSSVRQAISEASSWTQNAMTLAPQSIWTVYSEAEAKALAAQAGLRDVWARAHRGIANTALTLTPYLHNPYHPPSGAASSSHVDPFSSFSSSQSLESASTPRPTYIASSPLTIGTLVDGRPIKTSSAEDGGLVSTSSAKDVGPVDTSSAEDGGPINTSIAEDGDAANTSIAEGGVGYDFA